MKVWIFFAGTLALFLGGRLEAVVAESSDPNDRLDFVVIAVNGEPRKVDVGGELVAVAGDKIEIQSAMLKDPAKKIGNVNLIGYQSPKAARSGEDRGYEVNTERDLIKHWSVQHDGELYRVKASTGSKEHGEVFVRILKPKIKFAELMINGRKKMIREGELLRLRKTDQIAVKDVRTNIENDKEAVDFQIVPNEDVELPGVKLYEIRFSRSGSVFAKIPMQVEGYEIQPEN